MIRNYWMAILMVFMIIVPPKILLILLAFIGYNILN